MKKLLLLSIIGIAFSAQKAYGDQHQEMVNAANLAYRKSLDAQTALKALGHNSDSLDAEVIQLKTVYDDLRKSQKLDSEQKEKEGRIESYQRSIETYTKQMYDAFETGNEARGIELMEMIEKDNEKLAKALGMTNQELQAS